MLKLIRTLLRRLLAATAIAVILVAVGIGALRIVMAQLPAYQAELRAWLDDTLGLRVDFDTMDVRMGLRGPELTFYEVDVAAAEQPEPFLTASRAAVVIDPWMALAERELRVSRLRLEGTQLTLERGLDGALRLQGAPVGQARRDLAETLPVEVEIDVRDGRVSYLDLERDVGWEFQDVSVRLRRRAASLQLEATADPPDALARRFELAAQREVRGDLPAVSHWRVFGELGDVDLAVLSAALPGAVPVPSSGTGDVALWIDYGPGGVDRGMVDASLDDVAWTPAAGPAQPGYEHLSVSAEWQRVPDGWRLIVNDADVTRNGRTWPEGADTTLAVARADGREAIALRSGFLRLEDLAPIAAALPQSSGTARWLELAPHGDLAAVDLDVVREEGDWQYTIAAEFDRVGAEPWGRWPGVDGLSGKVRADTNSGRVELATSAAELDWPQLFRTTLDIDRLAGLIVWREGFDAVRVVSDDLVLSTSDGTTRSSLELTLPLDGGSPELDLETRLGGFQAVAAKRYLPVHEMPDRVVTWLDEAIEGGRVTGGTVEFVGPLRSFPFDGGEGLFRAVLDVEDGVLEFVRDWPRAEGLDGQIVFRNASFAASGVGRVLGNASRNIDVGIGDLRDAVLTVRGDTTGPLADVLGFLNQSPLIARYLGPGYRRLHAPAGNAAVSLDLSLPLRDMPAYELDAGLRISGGELAIDGFGPAATEVNGELRLADGAVTGDGIEAVFLDGPIVARVSPPEERGYRARLDVEGEVTADAAADAFSLPLAEYVAGQTRWQGTLLIPEQTDEDLQAAPLKVGVASNLSGVALNLPAPFEKAPADPTNLRLDFVLDAERLDVAGHVGASRRFVLNYAFDDERGIGFRRGALRFGGRMPEAPSAAGLTVDGTLPTLHFDQWLKLARADGGRRADGATLAGSGLGELFTEADLEIADFSVFGQELGSSRLTVRRDDDSWLIDVDSMPVAGSIEVPRNLSGRPAVVADMQRLHVEPRDGSGFGSLDPRRLLGLSLSSDDTVFGARRLGSLRADIQADPVGLRLVSFESSSDAFTVEGSGGWFVGPDGPATRLAFSLSAGDVAGALGALALDPIAEGEMAELTASVYWPGAPSADWMQHLGGDVSLRLETGSLVDIDPGAGRVVGLMSISALPRRLALDFRDVFNKGLVFDEISGDFAIVDGNAYTDNLKVTGPVAEIGVAGRIGLRDRDYRQQAVVTAEPGKMLPTVGGLIGGPGVGAALLIFTRIFKEPLKGIGRASYCVTGRWEEPVVERLSAEQLEQGQLCAELPADGVTMLQPEAGEP